MDQSVNVEKPEKFKVVDFKRWQQKMLFYLTTLNLAHVISQEKPMAEELPISKDTLNAIDAWTQSEFLGRNYIVNGLDDTLYVVYVTCNTAKELWESLEKKYLSQVASAGKFIIGKFLNYRMVDNKKVLNQVKELHIIIHELHTEGMDFDEKFQVGAIIEKLPPSWKDFKQILKHLTEDLSVQKLVLKLRVEEGNKINEKNNVSSLEANANIVEGDSSKSKPIFQKKNKGKFLAKSSFFFSKREEFQN